MKSISRAAIWLSLLLFYPVLTMAADYAAITPKMMNAAKQITADDIEAHVRFLSSDLLEGRGPATRSDKLTQLYLSTELESLGIQPGAPDGSWLQKVPLVRMTTKAPDAIQFVKGDKSLTLKNHDDFIASTGVQEENVTLNNAELVFVGYGVTAPEFGWDDYKDVDVKGKIVLVMNHNPAVFAGKTRLYYGRWSYKYEEAARHGAAGVIIIHTTPSAAYPWQVVQSSWTGELFELKDEGQPRVKLKAWATEDASKQIAALAGKDLDALREAAKSKAFTPVPLGVTLSIDLKNSLTKVESANVIGKIPGNDAALADQAIIYSAHHDHLGMKQNAQTGKRLIYNGAIDNASGVAALLAIAKAYAEQNEPVKRSVYFLLTAAEEQGLLGARYFVAHPPVPVNKIAADINIDGAGFYGITTDVLQYGKDKSSIDVVLNALASQEGRVVMADPYPERGSFYRADHFAFAKAGVPVLYMHPGVNVLGKPENWGADQVKDYIKNDYHQPSDKLKDTVDFSGAVKDARLEYYLGVNLANADGMPTWTKGDEFEARRLQSLG